MQENEVITSVKLSSAQARMLASARMQGGDWCVYYSGALSTMDALIRRGLVEYRTGLANRLTPAGIAIRAATLSKEGE